MHVARNLYKCLELLPTATSAYADETISFKGIKFGMNAEEIAKLGGGDTKYGCQSAINSPLNDKNKWTYGSVAGWSAICHDSFIGHGDRSSSQVDQVPGISGLYQIQTVVLAKNVSTNLVDTYSVDELVDIFSKIFGKFEIETHTVRNGFGEEFEKKVAFADANGARIVIGNVADGKFHDKAIYISITSLDYLRKEMNWKNQQNSQKLNNSQADF